MDGRFVCWVRHCSWIITCPMILFQINQLSSIRFIGIDMNSFLIVACEVMLVFGLSSSLSASDGIKWMFFSFGLLAVSVVFSIAFFVFRKATARFLDRGTYQAKRIAERIRLLAALFFLSWSAYPVLYILSGEGACVASERVMVVLYIVTDAFAKNAFGLLFWETSWNHLRGTWGSDLITGFTFPPVSPQAAAAVAAGGRGDGGGNSNGLLNGDVQRGLDDVTADLQMHE